MRLTLHTFHGYKFHDSKHFSDLNTSQCKIIFLLQRTQQLMFPLEFSCLNTGSSLILFFSFQPEHNRSEMQYFMTCLTPQATTICSMKSMKGTELTCLSVHNTVHCVWVQRNVLYRQDVSLAHFTGCKDRRKKREWFLFITLS